MSSASDIAAYLTYLAQSGDEPDPLTNLRLQKLLYYVQAWSLAMRGKPAFSERIEAWAHGPVVPAVYHAFKQHGHSPFSLTPSDRQHEFDLTDDEKAFVSEVWETYKSYSASKLRDMTHREEPWVNARQGYAPADRCSVEITQAALADYFGKMVA